MEKDKLGKIRSVLRLCMWAERCNRAEWPEITSVFREAKMEIREKLASRTFNRY